MSKDKPSFLERCKAAWAAGRSAYDDSGNEYPDPTPLEMPIGFERPPDLTDIVRSLTVGAMQQELVSKGIESFEESEDFDIPDDPVDPHSPWQDPELQTAFTHESEIRSGVVEHPNFSSAKELVAKAQAVLAKYDKDGNLKKPPQAPSA